MNFVGSSSANSVNSVNSVGIVRYPGSNCDIETFHYFNDLYGHNSCFYIWHNDDDLKLLDNLKLLVLPGGFAFGDRIYNKATETYEISPGTMALNSPVTTIIQEAYTRKIPILGICNGFQILTQLGFLPGQLVANDEEKFICKKTKCSFLFKDNKYDTELYIANTYGKYIHNDDTFHNSSYRVFLSYRQNGAIAGVCDIDKNVFGMMPHPERNNADFKHMLCNMLLQDERVNTKLLFDKSIHDLMFSEHISYKTTRKYLKTLHTKEDWVVQGPGENAGIVDIGHADDGTEYCIAIRIESHNHPTFIDPFEGAATGVGGIMRDIFTMGARPICILDFLRFGTDTYSKELQGKAIQGISYYGNCVGVPNVGGDLYTHHSYNKNPLVNVACLGLLKKENITYGNALNDNSFLIYVGSKTGNEGINGAAMASATFDNNTDTDELKHNVQKSDPFLEKLLLEACCEITGLKLVEGMQDMGAGGLLCASIEVVKRGRDITTMNMGCSIHLDKVPVKYKMEPVNILISESQERMLIVCQKQNIEQIMKIFQKWDLESFIIGETNSTGNYDVYCEKNLLYSKPMNSFTDVHDYIDITTQHKYKESVSPFKNKNMNLWSVYDSTVGNRTIKGPDQPGSYSIIDIPEVNKKLVLTWGEHFSECYDFLTSFEGVKPLCVVNCLNFGDPNLCLTDFVATVDELRRFCKSYKVPIVGGNVSLYNTPGFQSIRPTPVLLFLGITE